MKNYLTKSENHIYFWVNNGELFEVQRPDPNKGKVFTKICDVPGMENNSKCSEEDIEKIENLYLDFFNLQKRFHFYLHMIKMDPKKMSIVQLEETRRAFYGGCGITMDIIKNRVPELPEKEAIDTLLHLEKQISNFFIDQDNNFN